MKWYILYVQSGREQSISQQLIKMGYRTLCPLEKRLIRQGGQWKEKEYFLFKGYVFVRLAYSFPVYYKISKIKGVIKLLGGGKNPASLTSAEIAYIHMLARLAGEISVVRYENGNFIPIGGALVTLKDKIISVNRRQKRAKAALSFAGKNHIFTLSFTEQTPRTVSG